MCDPAKAKEAMPVDVYVGGVEHGELMGKKTAFDSNFDSAYGWVIN